MLSHNACNQLLAASRSCEVRNGLFSVKDRKFAKRKRELTTKFAIA